MWAAESHSAIPSHLPDDLVLVQDQVSVLAIDIVVDVVLYLGMLESNNE